MKKRFSSVEFLSNTYQRRKSDVHPSMPADEETSKDHARLYRRRWHRPSRIVEDIPWKTFAAELSVRKNEYRLQFQAPYLGVIWNIERGRIYVSDFADNDGVVLPAQSCSMIGIGDELIMINRVQLHKLDLVEKTDILSNIDLLTKDGVELTFRYRPTDIRYEKANPRLSFRNDPKKNATIQEPLFDFLDDEYAASRHSTPIPDDNQDNVENLIIGNNEQSTASNYITSDIISTFEMERRLLELELLHCLLLVPHSSQWFPHVQQQISVCRTPTRANSYALHLLSDAESAIYRVGAYLDRHPLHSVQSTLQITTTEGRREETNDDARDVRVEKKYLWAADENSTINGSSERRIHDTRSVQSHNNSWRNLKETGRSAILLLSLRMKRHFRHELVTLTHDTVDKMLHVDGDHIIQFVHTLMDKKGLPPFLPSAVDSDGEDASHLHRSGDAEEKQSSTISFQGNRAEDSRGTKKRHSMNSIDMKDLKSKIASNSDQEQEYISSPTQSSFVESATSDFQTNLFDYLFQGFTSQPAGANVGKSLPSYSSTNSRGSDASTFQRSYVQEVDTKDILEIPPLEITYSVYYLVIHLLPTLQSASLQHQQCASSCTSTECILCLLLRWTHCFNPELIWQVYQQRMMQSTHLGQINGVKHRAVIVNFVTAMTQQGKVSRVSDEKVDIAHFLEIVRDLVTLTVCLLISPGDLLVFDNRPPFDGILSTCRGSGAMDAMPTPYAPDAFRCLPLHINRNHSSMTHLVHEKIYSSAALHGQISTFMDRYRGLLNMQLMTIVAVRLQLSFLLHSCLDSVQYLLANENSNSSNAAVNSSISVSYSPEHWTVSDNVQQMLAYLLHPPDDVQVDAWKDVLQNHLLPALDAVGYYGSHVHDWKLPIILWLIRRLLRRSYDTHDGYEIGKDEAEDRERNMMTFVVDLLLSQFLLPIMTPFTVQELLFPEQNLQCFVSDANAQLTRLIDSNSNNNNTDNGRPLTKLVSKSIRDCKSEDSDSDENSEDTSVDDNRSLSDIYHELSTVCMPLLSRYQQYLTRFLRRIAQEEIGDSLFLTTTDYQDSSSDHGYDSSYQYFQQLVEARSKVWTLRCLNISLLLANYEAFQVTNQVKRSSNQHQHHMRQQKAHHKNKYFVGVRSLLRKASDGHATHANSSQLALVYAVNPRSALEVCVQHQFLDGIFVCLEMWYHRVCQSMNHGSKYNKNASSVGSKVTGIDTDAENYVLTEQEFAALFDSIAEVVLKECRRCLQVISSCLSRSLSQTPSACTEIDQNVSMIKDIFCRYIHWMQLFGKSISSEDYSLQPSEDNLQWIVAEKLLCVPLNRLVALATSCMNASSQQGDTGTILMNNTVYDSSNNADDGAILWSSVTPTIGQDTNDTHRDQFVRHIAEWCAYILLNQGRGGDKNCISLYCKCLQELSPQLVPWLTVEFILYLQQLGFLTP